VTANFYYEGVGIFSFLYFEVDIVFWIEGWKKSCFNFDFGILLSHLFDGSIIWFKISTLY
jgi:hypothetical protein